MVRKIGVKRNLSDEQKHELKKLLGDEMELDDRHGWGVEFTQDTEGLEVVFGGVKENELEALKDLRWVHAGGTGVEGMLTETMHNNDVVITCSRGHSAVQMSEHMIAGMFYLCRDFPAFEASNRAGEWVPKNFEMRMVEGSRAVILGLGGIGRVLAKKLAALGVSVIGVNSSGQAVEPCEAVYTLETIHEHLGDVDHVFNTLPSTPYTRKIVGQKFIAKLKDGAMIYNVGRGATVDQKALLAALGSGKLSGVVLDVTTPEPLPADSPLFKHPRILVTGHKSWQPHYENKQNAWKLFCENLRLYLESGVENLKSKVDKERGY